MLYPLSYGGVRLTTRDGHYRSELMRGKPDGADTLAG